MKWLKSTDNIYQLSKEMEVKDKDLDIVQQYKKKWYDFPIKLRIRYGYNLKA